MEENVVMCGIVGYIGYDNAKELLLKGLEKLEYRGYDSAGIAVVNDDNTTVFKRKGRIAELRKVADSAILMDLLESVTHVGQHTVYRIMKTLIHINHQMAVLL